MTERIERAIAARDWRALDAVLSEQEIAVDAVHAVLLAISQGPVDEHGHAVTLEHVAMGLGDYV